MATYMLPSPVPPKPNTGSSSFERPRALRSSICPPRMRPDGSTLICRARAGFFAAQPRIALALRRETAGCLPEYSDLKSPGVAAVLKNIDPLLSPELLSTLRAMGHGDELAIVDANYPAVSSGVPVIRLDAASTTQTLDAVLSVLPLDEFEPCAAFHMQVVGDPAGEQPIFQEFRELLKRHEPQVWQL